MIEINPRISTIVYQDDLNLPYLGVKRALGEISDDELAALRSRIQPGRASLRYFDQVDFDGPLVDSAAHAAELMARGPRTHLTTPHPPTGRRTVAREDVTRGCRIRADCVNLRAQPS